MFVKVNNGAVEKFPYSIGELQRDNPMKSFPQTFPDSVLNAENVYRVNETTAPDINERTQKRERKAIPDLVDGQWVWGWTVSDKTQDEITAETDREASNVRRQRNEMLAATDWRFRSDMTPSQAWVEYCQALRDITSQAGFPWDVTYPTAP